MSRPFHSPRDYHAWRLVPMRVASRSYDVATKPGVFADGRIDAAAMLLAEHAKIAHADVVVCLNGGNGLFGAVAAHAAPEGRVFIADRNVVSVEAARRTLDANGIVNAEVVLGQGSIALPPEIAADVVAIRIPPERLSLLQLLCDAFRMLKTGGRCYLAGATNEGVKVATTSAQRLFGNAGAVAHGGGNRVALAVKTSDVAGNGVELENPYLDNAVFLETDIALRGRSLTLFSRPGVFSWDHLDEATSLLAEAMVVNAGDAVLDLGCGAGAIGTLAAMLGGRGHACMVDADAEAVRCARRTADAAGMINSEVATSDVAAAVRDRRFDVIVTNPPFHVGKTTELSVPLQFIHESWASLAPGGRLYLVANRTLPYERVMHQLFGNIGTVHDGVRFKVLSAIR